jgi:hypothetical protein
LFHNQKLTRSIERVGKDTRKFHRNSGCSYNMRAGYLAKKSCLTITTRMHSKRREDDKHHGDVANLPSSLVE